MAKHPPDPGHGKTQRLLEVLITRLDTLIDLTKQLLCAAQAEKARDIAMALTIDDIVTKISNEATVVDSISTGVDAAVAKLAELRALVAAGGADPAKIQAALDAIDAASAQLQSKSDAIAAAVVDPPVIGTP